MNDNDPTFLFNALLCAVAFALVIIVVCWDRQPPEDKP